MNSSQFPIARKSGLVVQEMPDEVLVYDLDSDKAHCLNQTAANVWKACDGNTSIAELARTFGGGNEDLIWLAIDQLSENDLLEGKLSSSFKGQSRREVIKKIGLASMIAIPVIASLAAPQSALAAQSCRCQNNSQCSGPNINCPTTFCSCSGLCNAPGPVVCP